MSDANRTTWYTTKYPLVANEIIDIENIMKKIFNKFIIDFKTDQLVIPEDLERGKNK